MVQNEIGQGRFVMQNGKHKYTYTDKCLKCGTVSTVSSRPLDNKYDLAHITYRCTTCKSETTLILDLPKWNERTKISQVKTEKPQAYVGIFGRQKWNHQRRY